MIAAAGHVSRSWSQYYDEKYEDKKYCQGCKMTSDKKFLPEASMVVFSNAKGDNILPPPAYRRADRIWAFFSRETPLSANSRREESDLGDWNRLFNWTVTYRFDSDIPALSSGQLRRKPRRRSAFQTKVSLHVRYSVSSIKIVDWFQKSPH
jgi:hypothetical protein